jgi:hypothetical protein
MTQYFGRDLARQIVSKIETLPLPSDPETLVRIKQLPIGVLRRLGDSSTQDGAEGDKARAELIQRSIVDESGNPIFDADYPLMEELTVELLTDLMTLIGKANNKSAGKSFSQQVDDAEKNSNPTS